MTLAEGLFEEIANWPQVEAIALGGSRATNNYDKNSDYDVYLYCTEPVPEELRKATLEKFCSYLEIGNHYWEQEDNCTFKDGVDIDILYRNLDDFSNDVARVVEDCVPANGYTTCMWHNLRTCRIVYDRDGRLAKVKERFDVGYPKGLRRAILERNLKLMHGVLPSYDAQIHKATQRNDYVSVNHRVAAYLESYFDVIFALNKLTHPGEKRQITIAKRDCGILPKDFTKNLNTLFSDMFHSPEDLDEDLHQLNNELRKVVREVDLQEQLSLDLA